MTKPNRLAACEPCRRLKMACDHNKPVCFRCTRSGRPGNCVYRERPFKKRRHESNAQARPSPILYADPQVVSMSPDSPAEQEAREHYYPNSGHLGISSSANIFNRIPSNNGFQETSPAHTIPTTPGSIRLSSRSSKQQIQVLEEALSSIDPESLKNLMNFWLAKKIRLGLSSLFIGVCTQTLQSLLNGTLFDLTSLTTISQKISKNSTQPLVISASSSPEDLIGQVSGVNIRWESIALALIMAGRATTDVPFFPPLYTCRTELCALQRSLADLSDSCLDIVLSLDSMNEFQLICQYESFILHSVVDGDQSYNAWRRLGDVISSLLFLGLHESITDQPDIPSFFTELRRSVFAQIYSDDKNMAVFLGRPPRLNRTFCCFQLPRATQDNASRNSALGRPMADVDYEFFSPDDQADFITGLRWTACCASLKEEILEALQGHDPQTESVLQRFTLIRVRAESLWRTLPDHLRLENSIRLFEDRSPLERDFVLNTRLTYLQILFLTKISVVSRGNNEVQDEELRLLQCSQEMLSLVVEAIILRDQLVNSGTSLHWKVAHYGLPAAGVICFFMLRPSFWRLEAPVILISKLMQDLGVFASEVQVGGLLQTDAPNFALLYRATSTIQSLLGAVFSPGGLLHNTQRVERVEGDLSQQESQLQIDPVAFDLSAYTDLWGFEFDFWQDLGAHPSLMISGVSAEPAHP